MGRGGKGREGEAREGEGERKEERRDTREDGGEREGKNVRRQSIQNRSYRLALRLGWKKEEGMRIGVGGKRRRGWESGRERQ